MMCDPKRSVLILFVLLISKFSFPLLKPKFTTHTRQPEAPRSLMQKLSTLCQVDKAFADERRKHFRNLRIAQERFGGRRLNKAKRRIRAALRFMDQRMHDRLVKETKLDEEFGIQKKQLAPDAARSEVGKPCIHTFTGLKAGTSFQFRVRACNHVGSAKWSPLTYTNTTLTDVPR